MPGMAVPGYRPTTPVAANRQGAPKPAPMPKPAPAPAPQPAPKPAPPPPPMPQPPPPPAPAPQEVKVQAPPLEPMLPGSAQMPSATPLSMVSLGGQAASPTAAGWDRGGGGGSLAGALGTRTPPVESMSALSRAARAY